MPAHLPRLLPHRLLACSILAVSALALPAIAEENAPSPDPAKRIEALRSEAERLRTQADTDYLAAETACYKRFLVNNCIDDAKTERLVSVRSARALEAEAHRIDLAERNRVAAEVAKKAEAHAEKSRPTHAAAPSADVAVPSLRPDIASRPKGIKPNTNKARERAKTRSKAAQRASAARRDRERYDARIRELEEKKARDADGR